MEDRSAVIVVRRAESGRGLIQRRESRVRVEAVAFREMDDEGAV